MKDFSKTDFVNMVNCLKNKDIKQLLYGLKPYSLTEFMNQHWAPVIDGRLLKKHPLEYLKSNPKKSLLGISSIMLGKFNFHK